MAAHLAVATYARRIGARASEAGTLAGISMDPRPRTPWKTEVSWFLAVLLVAAIAGVVGLVVFVGRLQSL